MVLAQLSAMRSDDPQPVEIAPRRTSSIELTDIKVDPSTTSTTNLLPELVSIPSRRLSRCTSLLAWAVPMALLATAVTFLAQIRNEVATTAINTLTEPPDPPAPPDVDPLAPYTGLGLKLNRETFE